MNSGISRPQRDLTDAAARCEQAAGRYLGDTAGQQRAREILASTARSCRAAAGQLTADPTLATESPFSNRLRGLDLLCELARMSVGWVDSAERDWPSRTVDPRTSSQRWADVEDLHQRFIRCAEQVPAIIRADHATVTGSQEISLARLVPERQRLQRAAETIRDCIAGAMLLPHPHPGALELADLADRIQDQADRIASTMQAHPRQKRAGEATSARDGRRAPQFETAAHVEADLSVR